MAPTVLTDWPSEIDAGTTVKLTRSFTDFPPSAGWSLTAYLAGASILSVAATVSGNSFLVTLTAAQTAGLVAGTYQVQELATLAGETYMANEAIVVVVASASTAAAGDLQLQDEKDLIVVKAAINGRLTADQQSYQIGNRMVTKIPILDLYKIEATLTSRISARKNPGKFGMSGQIVFDGTTGP